MKIIETMKTKTTKRLIMKVDEHAQRGQFGNLIHDFVRIKGDIYGEQPD